MVHSAEGVISWGSEGDPYYNYVIYERDPANLEQYKPGGASYKDAQFEFIPVIHGGRDTGWYKLKNRGRLGAYLTFQPWKADDLSQKKVNYMIMESCSRVVEGRRNEDLLLRPEKVRADGETYYRLKVKNLEFGVVTSSVTRYGQREETRYIVVNSNAQHVRFFQEGGKWFGDDLFTIGNGDNEAETNEEKELNDLHENV